MVRFPAGGALTAGATPGNSQPSYLGTSTDPNTGAVITRVADATAFGNAGVQFHRHAYPKKQPWSKNGDMMMMDFNSPRVLIDGNTYTVLNTGISFPSYPTWFNTDNRYIYGIINQNAIVRADMTNNGARTTLHTFSGHSEMSIGEGEGNPDNNDRYIPLLSSPNGGSSYSMTVWDTVDDAVEAQMTGLDHYDWIGMSQLGAYIVVNWGQEGSGNQQGTKAYPLANFTDGGAIHLTNGVEHGDLGIDRAGNEVYVCINYLDAGARIQMIRLSDGTKTTLIAEPPTYIQGHMSCRNVLRPGWAYFSSNADDDDTNPGFDKIVAIELKAGGAVQTFCHMHHNPANRETYGNQPHSAPNRDGSRVCFASDWGGNGSAKVYSYVAEMLREDSAGPLGPF